MKIIFEFLCQLDGGDCRKCIYHIENERGVFCMQDENGAIDEDSNPIPENEVPEPICAAFIATYKRLV